MVLLEVQVHQELLDLVEPMDQVVLQVLVGQVEVLELLDLVEQMAQVVLLVLQEQVVHQDQMVLLETQETQVNQVLQLLQVAQAQQALQV